MYPRSSPTNPAERRRSCSMPRRTRSRRGLIAPRTPCPTRPSASRRAPHSRELEDPAAFARRHIGPDADEQAAMLAVLGFASLDALIDAVVPAAIRAQRRWNCGAPRTEGEALGELRRIAAKNQVFRSFIGQGYYDTHTPAVILRNILRTRPGTRPTRPTRPRSRRGGWRRCSTSRRWSATSPACRSPTRRCSTRRPPPPKR